MTISWYSFRPNLSELDDLQLAGRPARRGRSDGGRKGTGRKKYIVDRIARTSNEGPIACPVRPNETRACSGVSPNMPAFSLSLRRASRQGCVTRSWYCWVPS